jgi:hypothetical protein
MHLPPMDDRCCPRGAPCRAVDDSSIHSIGAYAPEWRNAPGRRRLLVRLAAACVVVAALVSGCSRTPPEQALRDTIATMQAAAEARDADALAEPLAADFVGPGGMDVERFRRYAALAWLRSRDVGVTLGPLDVEVTGEHARVRFTAATRGGQGVLPDSAGVYEVDTAWRLDGGEWRLISAEWEPVL